MAQPDERETSLGRLDEKVDKLLATLDKRFDAVDAVFLDHRLYTEHAFETVRKEMRSGFEQMDGRFNRLERKLDQFIDRQGKTNELIERKLDQFIDTQAKANELSERRLTRLENA